MKVYIAAHCKWAACYFADMFRSDGRLQVVSTWHGFDFLLTEAHSEAERLQIALTDADEVAASDALALIAGKEKYSGGKFVEAGVAIGLKKPVVVIGRRENMLLWHPLVTQVDTADAAILALLQGSDT